MKLQTRFANLLLVLAGTVAPACGADWTETFDSGFDQSWISAGLTRFGTPSTSFFFDADGILRMGDPVRGIGEGDPIQYGAVVGYGFVNETFTNVRVTGTVNPNHESHLNASVGLIARGNPLAGTSYSFGVDWFDTFGQPDGEVAIVRNDGASGEKIIAQTFLQDFALTDSLYLQFDLAGPFLSGKVFDQPGGQLLAEVLAIDGTYADGVCGVGVHTNAAAGRHPLYATYDDISASELPPVVCAVQTDTLWAPNHDLRDVGLLAETAIPLASIDVDIYANETDRGESVDDVFFDDAGNLLLSAERNGNGDGRVYLIVVTATNDFGDSATTCCSVVVPHDESEEAFVTVTQEAAAAELECLLAGGAPDDYVLIGSSSSD